MIICLDAGHYLETPGKRCMKALDPKETREWSLNERIARKVQSFLSKYDCTTMRVDDTTGKTEVTLYNRVTKANKSGATCYVSIHHNAGISGGTGGGIVVYAHPQSSEASRQLQQITCDHLIKETGLKGNRSNPVALADLYVLRKTTMPAILCECGFMDSATDVPIILTDEFATNAARGIAEAIVEMYNISPKSGSISGTEAEYQKWVAFMDRYLAERAAKPASDYAVKLIEEAKALGITADGANPQGLASREDVMLMALAAAKAK